MDNIAIDVAAQSNKKTLDDCVRQNKNIPLKMLFSLWDIFSYIPIKNLTAHYNIHFCVSINFSFAQEAQKCL